MQLEPHQYWTIAGFIFLFAELITLRGLPLTIAGSMFFAAVAAYKYPELYHIQVLTFTIFLPIIYAALRHISKK